MKPPYDQKVERGPEFCPHCGADQKSEPIPEKSREHYGDSRWFKRTVGVYCYEKDRTTHFECPDCGEKI